MCVLGINKPNETKKIIFFFFHFVFVFFCVLYLILYLLLSLLIQFVSMVENERLKEHDRPYVHCRYKNAFHRPIQYNFLLFSAIFFIFFSLSFFFLALTQHCRPEKKWKSNVKWNTYIIIIFFLSVYFVLPSKYT